eukprot:scaffold3611_cov364-Prasinococcus_capsulatus_cf.AAC.1
MAASSTPTSEFVSAQVGSSRVPPVDIRALGPCRTRVAESIPRVLPNGVGHMELNKPKALNACDRDMVRTMLTLLREWRLNERVKCVLVSSTSPRALSSGGDVKALALAKMEDPQSALNEEVCPPAAPGFFSRDAWSPLPG